VSQQFDLVENLNPASRGQYPLLVVLQHDRISAISTVVVAPLIAATRGVAGMRLHPRVDVAGIPYLILIEQLAAIPRQMLGRVVGNVGTNRYEMVAALDMLFTGI